MEMKSRVKRKSLVTKTAKTFRGVPGMFLCHVLIPFGENARWLQKHPFELLGVKREGTALVWYSPLCIILGFTLKTRRNLRSKLLICLIICALYDEWCF